MNLIVTNSQTMRTFYLTLLLGLVIAVSSSFLQAQQKYDLDYQPYEPTGLIPDDYLNIIKGESKINFRNTLYLSKEEKEHFRNATNYTLKEMFITGDIYINDPMTAYVRRVASSLLENSPLRDKIRLYVGKSTTINATSWQDGTIIINIGLLSRLKNEDQLAFVIAHELSHINLQHPYQQYANYIKHGEDRSHNHSLAEGFNATDYVLQHELMADSMALSFMYKAGYEGEEAIFALEVLLYKEQRNTPNLLTFFSTPNYSIDNTQLCESKEYNAFTLAAINSTNKHFSDDNLMTRLKSIRSQINERNEIYAMNTHKGGFTNTLYHPIGQMASFENVNQSFLDGNYLLSIYEALILLEKYPNNNFLHIKIAENLYYINSYNNLGVINRIFQNSQQINENDYAKFCCLINKLTKNNFQQFAYEFILNTYKAYPENETILITTAKITESYKGLETAKTYYKNYLRHYPDGKHTIEVKRILE